MIIINHLLRQTQNEMQKYSSLISLVSKEIPIKLTLIISKQILFFSLSSLLCTQYIQELSHAGSSNYIVNGEIIACSHCVRFTFTIIYLHV